MLVIASERETGPLVLLDTLACGIPVVSTPVGRAPELIRPGVTGDLFPAGDAVLLADRLSALLNGMNDLHHLRRMGQAARQLAEEQLSLTVFHTCMRSEIKHTLEKSC